MTDTARSVNASDAWFSAAVTGTLTALVDRAAAATNATRKYFATAEMDFDPKLYGLAQCAPDLTPAQCQGCLRNLQNVVVSARFLSGRPPSNSAFVVWCSLRYSVSPIYDGRAMLQLAAPPEPPPSATLTPPSSGSMFGVCREEKECSWNLCRHRLFRCIDFDSLSIFLPSVQAKD